MKTYPPSLNGIGVGLRAPHIAHILQNKPNLKWFELLADNHIVDGGWWRQQAIDVADIYPVTLHCVGMSIGSVDPLNFKYLDKIKMLARQLNPVIISDHLCWTSIDSHYSHDLLPLPYTEEALNHISERILRIQDYLGRRIAVENVSAYLTYKHSTINEVEFINALAEKSDSNILLDLNNLYVNSVNNHQNIDEYLNCINVDRIVEIHLAGFEDKGKYCLDSHNCRVHKNVWRLYEKFMQLAGNKPTLIEWDHDIPEFSVLMDEARRAEVIFTSITDSHEHAIAS